VSWQANHAPSWFFPFLVAPMTSEYSWKWGPISINSCPHPLSPPSVTSHFEFFSFLSQQIPQNNMADNEELVVSFCAITGADPDTVCQPCPFTCAQPVIAGMLRILSFFLTYNPPTGSSLPRSLELEPTGERINPTFPRSLKLGRRKFDMLRI